MNQQLLLYINDKFESGEVVINAGVRIDNFMMIIGNEGSS